MKDNLVVLTEKYSPNGVCIERDLNGYPLAPDTEPSVVIITNCDWIVQKKYMTAEEVKNRYGLSFGASSRPNN